MQLQEEVRSLQQQLMDLKKAVGGKEAALQKSQADIRELHAARDGMQVSLQKAHPMKVNSIYHERRCQHQAGLSLHFCQE